MEQIPSISRFAALSIAVFFSAAASAGGLDRDMAADMSSAGEAPGNQTSDMPSATLFEESAENQASAADDRMLLDSIPGWIRRNVTFPEDAYQYGPVGVEKFVVSADWTGRVFISSPLNALNPAVAEEIKSVVSRAPRCRFAGVLPEDIYKLVELDFGQYFRLREKMK